ncbi:MAG: EMC3/TMCO1 family protein [Candidatus Heimdallarchaeota archaeon]
MASIIEEILDFVPSLVRRFGPENPPESSLFIAVVALGLSLSLTLLSRYLIDIDKLARYTRETKAYNKMKMKAMRTADKKLQLQVDRQSRRAKKMQSELMNMRMRPLMFYFLPLMIIFFSMSSHYNFSPGADIMDTTIILNGDSIGPSNEDLQILSHANDSLTYYNETLRIVGTVNTSLESQILFNISGIGLMTEEGVSNGTATLDRSWWTVKAEPRTIEKNTLLQVNITLKSTVDGSILAKKLLNIRVADDTTIDRVQVTSHPNESTFAQGEPIRLFGTSRPKRDDRFSVRDSAGNNADTELGIKQAYWNLTLAPSNEASKTIKLELFKINRSDRPLAAIFPFSLPTEKILMITLGWNRSIDGRNYFVPMFVWWYFAVNISFGAAMQKIAGLSPD